VVAAAALLVCVNHHRCLCRDNVLCCWNSSRYASETNNVDGIGDVVVVVVGGDDDDDDDIRDKVEEAKCGKGGLSQVNSAGR